MRGMSYIIEPDDQHKRHRVGGVRCPGGKRIRVGGFDDRRSTERLKLRLDALSGAALQGDPPPAELAGWLASLDEKLAERLSKAGLIQRRHIQQGRPLAEHIDEYRDAVAARKNNSDTHADAMKQRVSAVVDGVKAESYTDLNQHDVEVWVSSQGWRPSNQRHYLVAAKDFTKWMLGDKRAASDPLADIKLPKPVEQFDRRPFTREEVGQLVSFLWDFEFYPDQTKGSVGTDRAMVYWTAACTGLRRTELASIRRHQLHLGDDPSIEISGRNTKNKADAVIPIPRDLAESLAEYASLLSPSAKVFAVPTKGRKRQGALSWLERDLKACGLDHLLELGDEVQVDFHAFRATAIVWWSLLGYSDLEVQRFARLKTPGLVAKYRRHFGQPGRSKLDAGPSLVSGHNTNKKGIA